MNDEKIKVYIPLTPQLLRELRDLPDASAVEVEVEPKVASFIVKRIQEQLQSSHKIPTKRTQQQLQEPSYKTARQSLLRSIVQDVAVAETAARALEHLELAEDTRVDRDTPAAFVEHAKRLLDADDRHNVVELARQAVDEWEEDDEDEDD